MQVSLGPHASPTAREVWHTVASVSHTTPEAQVAVQRVPAVVAVWVQRPAVPVGEVDTQSWFIAGVAVFCGQLVSHTLHVVVAEMKQVLSRQVSPLSQPPLALQAVSAAVPLARHTPESAPRSPPVVQVDVVPQPFEPPQDMPSATTALHSPVLVLKTNEVKFQ